MDQFSHDLAVALEETSLLDRARVGGWGQRRRTRSTGNLPCAPQPTEDSSSSPTDAANQLPAKGNIDGLTAHDKAIHSDSDEKEDAMRLPFTTVYRSIRLGTIESDSLNETFSPARFFKPNTRRKRKFKRMSVEYDPTMQYEYLEPSSFTGTIRKRVLKPEVNRSATFFSGKRKRSNKDRYHDGEQTKLHSSSMPRQNFMLPTNSNFEDQRVRPRSYSSTSQTVCDRILPLNKGLVSKIEKISKLQKTATNNELDTQSVNKEERIETATNSTDSMMQTTESADCFTHKKSNLCRKKCNSLKREKLKTHLQFDEQMSMECGELYDFLSSSSLSSSESDDEQRNDTDREGDDELTDWPGNESNIPCDSKYDFKRKLTKKPQVLSLKYGETASIAEDDTVMSNGDYQVNIKDTLELKYNASEPIAINKNISMQNSYLNNDVGTPLKQIESEMSGETSNTFLSSPPYQGREVREIRAGCRRIKCERPGFSIKTSVNERLARFLQDARQTQIRLPDIEIYEHESLINLAKLYSLQMSLDKGCAVLTKTSNTTQSVNIDQQSFQAHLFLSDYKRRCYDSKGNFLPRK